MVQWIFACDQQRLRDSYTCVCTSKWVCIYFHLEFHSHPVDGIARRCAKPANSSPLCAPEKCFSPIIYGLHNFCLSVIGFIVLINVWHFISPWCPQCRRSFRAILCGLMVNLISRVSAFAVNTSPSSCCSSCSMLSAQMNGGKYSHVLLANRRYYAIAVAFVVCSIDF